MKKLFAVAAVGVLAFSAPAWADGGYGACAGLHTAQTEAPKQTTRTAQTAQTPQRPRQTAGVPGTASQPDG